MNLAQIETYYEVDKMNYLSCTDHVLDEVIKALEEYQTPNEGMEYQFELVIDQLTDK